MTGERVVYKILSPDDARRFRASGTFGGSLVDRRDGYIHLSTASQLRRTLALHYKGAADLAVLAIDLDAVSADALRWEPSRGGQLFPHLYAELPWASVVETFAVDVDAQGTSSLPVEFT